MPRNERFFAAAAVKSPDDWRAQRPFTTTAGVSFHAAMALASSMVTQNDRGWGVHEGDGDSPAVRHG